MLDLQEPLARQHEAAVGIRRQILADSYRRIVGVHPDQRLVLRSALDNIRDGCGGSVADVVAQVRAQLNSLSPGTS